MMGSRELVQRAARFQRPERVPYDLPDEFGSDFLWVGLEPDPAWKPSVKGQDEWGCIWSDPSPVTPKGSVIVHPLQDYEKLDSLAFPDFKSPGRYARIRKLIAENNSKKFVVANTRVNFVERIKFLRGFEETYSDPLLYPDGTRELLKRLCDAQLTVVKQFADAGADGIFWCDDLGSQDRPIYSPQLFREMFKPHYKKVFDYAHSRGLVTFMHSCGHIVEIMDDLIDSGLDVIQLDQQENMGIDLLSRRFGGRIAFWCPVDIQRTMVTGSPDDVALAARKMMYSFGNYNGGFIGKWFWVPSAIGHTTEKLSAMCNAFVKHGRYPLSAP